MAGTGQTPRLKRLLLQTISKWRIKGLVVSPELASSTDKITCIEVQSHNYSGPAREVSVESCYGYTSLNTASWDSVTWKARSCDGISVSGKQATVCGNRCKNVNFGKWGYPLYSATPNLMCFPDFRPLTCLMIPWYCVWPI
jgi:hypothetical protein